MLIRRIRQELLRLLVAGVVVYVLVVVYLAYAQTELVFPGAWRARPDRIPDLPKDFQKFTLKTQDGVDLVAHRSPAGGAESRWVIFFTGQWGRARWDLPKIALLRELGWEVLTFDYRGYGESGGKPSEAGLARDADAAYEYLTRTLGVAPSRILLVAHSLGTGVAVDLASRVSAAGLIVDGSYDSVVACASARFPWLPISWVTRDRFDSASKIGKVTMPKLFLHGEFDESIPIARGRALFSVAPEPKRFVTLEGRHEDFQWSDPERYRQAMTEFVASVGAGQSGRTPR